MGNRAARTFRLFWRTLLEVKEGITTIMSKLDDLKAADAAEAEAVTEALVELKAQSEQHAADLAALAAKPQLADDPDLSSLVASIAGRATSLKAGIAALHATVSAPAAADTAAADNTAAGTDTVVAGMAADTVAGGAAIDSVSGGASAT